MPPSDVRQGPDTEEERACFDCALPVGPGEPTKRADEVTHVTARTRLVPWRSSAETGMLTDMSPLDASNDPVAFPEHEGRPLQPGSWCSACTRRGTALGMKVLGWKALSPARPAYIAERSSAYISR
jgi:hypothetical protein